MNPVLQTQPFLQTQPDLFCDIPPIASCRYVDLLGMVWQQASKQLQEQQPALITTPGPTSKKGSSSSSSAAAGLGGAKLPSKASSKSSKSSKAATAAAAGVLQQQTGKHISSSSTADAHGHSSGNSKLEWLLSNLILEGQRHLAMGLLRLQMAMPLVKLQSNFGQTLTELPFNSEAQRFDQRFAAFHQLQRPEPLTYEQYVQSTSVEGVNAGQLLRLAGDSFKRVSALLLVFPVLCWFVCALLCVSCGVLDSG
jgi:hypothetical protein